MDLKHRENFFYYNHLLKRRRVDQQLAQVAQPQRRGGTHYTTVADSSWVSLQSNGFCSRDVKSHGMEDYDKSKRLF